MAVTIPASPTGSMTVADQSLIYTLLTGTASPLPAGFRIWVKVYENGTSAADLISTLYLTPNTNKTAFFNLAEVVKGRVSVDDRRYGLTNVIHEPISTGLYMTRSNNNVKLYTVSVGEFNGSTEGSQDASATIYLIDGHFQISQGYDPGFANYYGTANTVKYWLTDRPTASNVITIDAAEEDEGVCAFLNRSAVSNVEQLTILLYDEAGAFITGTTTTILINTATGGQLPGATSQYYYGYLCYFGILPANIDAASGLLTANPTWGHYTITPQQTSFAVQKGNAIRVNKNCRPVKNTPVQLAWANTLGGWDYLRFDGRDLKTVTRQEKTYRKIIGDYDAATFAFTSFDREKTPYQVEATEAYQLNGILTSDEFALFQYCFRSKNIMAKIDGSWIPVILKESSLQVESDVTSKVYIATVNVELAQSIRC